MIKDIELDGKIVKIEFILPDEVKKFLEKNNIEVNQLLRNYKWEQSICEDLNEWDELDKDYKMKNNFEKAKLVINYIHFSQDNQIRVPIKDFPKNKRLVSSNWTKGSFSKDFSIGYSLFVN